MAELESEDVVAISGKLKDLREQKGLSLEAVAESLNLSVEQIADLEALQCSVEELTPFQRGYLRNYANLIEMDIKEFEDQFPDGIGVGSDLYSVQRYSYKVSKPIMSRGWVRAFIYLAVAVVLFALISSLDLNLDELTSMPDISEGTQITLPQLEEAPIEEALEAPAQVAPAADTTNQ